MKKLLLSSFLAFGLTAAYGQTMETQNFNALNLGDLGTQGGYATAGGTAADYQIVQIDAAHGNSLNITGSATATGTRYAFTDKLGAAWAARTTGNNILTVMFDIYTGPQAGTGVGNLRSVVYDSSFTIMAGIFYDYATKTIKGIGRGSLNGGAQGNYSFNLGTQTYEPNTWVSVSYSYDYDSGRITWTHPGGSYYIQAGTSGTNTWVLNPGVNPDEHDFLSTVSTGNTVAHTSGVDNLRMEAASTVVLATQQATVAKNLVSFYPNPATDVVKFTTDVQSVQIFDLTGKSVINTKVTGNTLDVNNLKAGMYLLKIQTKDGVTTEKLIKK